MNMMENYGNIVTQKYGCASVLESVRKGKNEIKKIRLWIHGSLYVLHAYAGSADLRVADWKDIAR